MGSVENEALKIKRDEILKKAEDRVSLFLNGGRCTQSNHDAADELDILVMIKQLRIARPHQSFALNEVEHLIYKALHKD